MIQGRGGTSFPLETFERLPILGQLFGQELQGDAAAELGVFGLVDHTHAAATELLQDAVVRDGLADHGRTSGSLVAIIGSTWMQVNAEACRNASLSTQSLCI